MVRIDSWDPGSTYPHGHFVQSLGRVGDLETETQTLLIEHSLAIRVFSDAQVGHSTLCLIFLLPFNTHSFVLLIIVPLLSSLRKIMTRMCFLAERTSMTTLTCSCVQGCFAHVSLRPTFNWKLEDSV